MTNGGIAILALIIVLIIVIIIGVAIYYASKPAVEETEQLDEQTTEMEAELQKQKVEEQLKLTDDQITELYEFSPYMSIDQKIQIDVPLDSINHTYELKLTKLGNLEICNKNEQVVDKWTGYYTQDSINTDINFDSFKIDLDQMTLEASGIETQAEKNLKWTLKGTIKPNGYVNLVKKYVDPIQGFSDSVVNYFGYLLYDKGTTQIRGIWKIFQNELYADGLFAFQTKNNIKWTSNTFGYGKINYAKLTSNGLQLFGDKLGQETLIWSFSSNNAFKYKELQNGLPSKLILTDEGDLIITNQYGNVIQIINQQLPNQLRVGQTIKKGDLFKTKDAELYLYLNPMNGLLQTYLGNPKDEEYKATVIQNTGYLPTQSCNHVYLSTTGRLIGLTDKYETVWSVGGTSEWDNICNLSFQQDMNLVINTCDFKAIWASDHYIPSKMNVNEFNDTRSIILKAPSLPFILYLHMNGNLALYQDFVNETNLGKLIWESKINVPNVQKKRPKFTLKENGINISLDGVTIWQQPETLKDAKVLELSDNRNLYIYNVQYTDNKSVAIWNSKTSY